MKQLFEIDCDPACGFMVKSHNKGETIKMAREHLKDIHGKDTSEDDASKMVKTV